MNIAKMWRICFEHFVWICLLSFYMRLFVSSVVATPQVYSN